MYRLPPAVASAQAASGAGVGVALTTQLIPAPGAGKRLRIAFIQGGPFYNNGANVHCQFLDSGGVATIGFLTFGNAAPEGDEILYPEPGLQLPVNTALQVTMTGGAAAQNAIFVVGYYTDNA